MRRLSGAARTSPETSVNARSGATGSALLLWQGARPARERRTAVRQAGGMPGAAGGMPDLSGMDQKELAKLAKQFK